MGHLTVVTYTKEKFFCLLGQCINSGDAFLSAFILYYRKTYISKRFPSRKLLIKQPKQS